MTGVDAADARAAFDRRRPAGEALAADAGAIALACRDMADRFAAGATLLAFGSGGPATDAAHVAVEFVHPVIVGKRALPAVSLAADTALLTGVAAEDGYAEVFTTPLALLARPGDIALGFTTDGRDAAVTRALELAHDRGLLTVAVAGGDGGPLAGSPAVDHLLLARTDDPRVVKEVQVTTYHVLWELVHVFLERADLQGPAMIR